MSVHHETMQALIEMGIEPPKARAAAQRFTKTDAAVNWCFSDGMDWTEEEEQRRLQRAPPPTPSPPNQPLPDVVGPGTTVEHREVAQTQSDTSSTHTEQDIRSPPLPPRRDNATAIRPLGDKNPFRSTATAVAPKIESNNPFAPHQPSGGAADAIRVEGQDDEDEDLRRALEMSREGMDVDADAVAAAPALAEAEEDERDRQRRNVRVEGPPPPSPTSGPTDKPVFGPSTKTDTDNSMAMTPFNWDEATAVNTNANSSSDNSAFPGRSKEDEDMDKAIQDSLMSASFHSAASAAEDRDKPQPQQVIRTPGTPLALYSKSGQSGSAGLLQGLLAIPRIRDLLSDVVFRPEDGQSSVLADLRHIATKADTDLEQSFVDVDPVIRELKARSDPKTELPPTFPVRAVFGHLQDTLEPVLRSMRDEQHEQWQQAGLPQPGQLFVSRIVQQERARDAWHTFVTCIRRADLGDLYAHMADELWNDRKTNIYIEQLPDIMTVYLASSPDTKREVFKLDREIIMDRFMTRNMAWSVQTRAMQGLAEGDVRRLNEKLSSYTSHDGNDIAASIKNTIKHYEAYPGNEDMDVQQRSEVKAKLESVLAKLQAKVADLKQELEVKEAEARGSLFETDDPGRRQEVYLLRAILFYDGALMGNKHLYMYMLGEQDQWWKVQDHEVKPVDWSDIATDSTGLYMDGGPYCLLYDRVSPRVLPYIPRDAQPPAQTLTQPTTESQQPDAPTLVDTDTDPAPQSATSQETVVPASSAQADLLGDEMQPEAETPTPSPRPPPPPHPDQQQAPPHQHRPLPKPPTAAPPPARDNADGDVDMS